MNNTQNNDIDKLLEQMKERSCPEQEYKTPEAFKAEFFEKAAQQKKPNRFFKALFITAASVLISGIAGVWALSLYTSAVPIVCSTPAVIADNKMAFAESAPLLSRVSKAPRASMAPGSIPPVGSASPIVLCDSDARFSHAGLRYNTEEYKYLQENKFLPTALSPLSTFGADADTASYSNVRRFLLQGNCLPPADAVRTEEFLNYFSYDYKKPRDNGDFTVNFESMPAPWAPERQLLLIGVQAKDVDKKELPPSNFVFLIDNSGSMCDVFPMVREAMTVLADQLRPHDRISIVTYGGSVTVHLDGGSGADKRKVKSKINALSAGGFTSGGAGILEAYKLAHKHFIKGGNNRIVLITDGDFNVGVSSESELVKLVEKERQSAIYLSAFGVGSGNYKDNKLKMLANKGNGNYSYLDNPREAHRVMTNEMTGKMFTFAKDVKFQIEFSPARVAAYRLIGYELRKMAARDFNDDTKDSGEVGMGHQVTALYELIMADAPSQVKEKYMGNVDKLKYQSARSVSKSDELLTFKLRYQQIEGKAPSRLKTFVLKGVPEASGNIRWASAVAEFSLCLRNSEYKGKASYKALRKRASKELGKDEDGKRAEFLTLVKAAEDLQN